MLGVASVHTLTEDIRMAALEALPPKELERHCSTPTVTVGHVPESEFSMRKQEDTLHPSWVKSQRLEKTEMTLWMLEDLDNGKGDQDKRTRRRSKVSVGIAGKQVINRRTAGQGHSSNRVKDSRDLWERETM